MMIDTQNPPAEDNDEEATEALSDQSVLDLINARRKEIRPEQGTCILEVPGYLGLLAVEYKFIDADETETIAKKILKETRNTDQGQGLLGSLDTLIAACKQVLMRGSTSEEWRPLRQGEPVKFTGELASVLGYPASNAREVVLGLFRNEHAITQANVQLSRWLSDTTRKVDEDFLF